MREDIGSEVSDNDGLIKKKKCKDLKEGINGGIIKSNGLMGVNREIMVVMVLI